MFEFAWPWLLLALPLPVVARWLPPVQRSEAALKVPDFTQLRPAGSAAADGSQRRPGWRLALLWLCWLLLVIAVARPQYVGEAVALPVSGRDLMLAVDISGSMGTEDMTLNQRRVTRLAMVKEVVADFVLRRTGDRLGLILFGSKAYVQAPLTFDRQTLGTLLQEAPIGIAGGKTAIGDAIGLSVKRLMDRPGDQQVLVLLTDGANNIGELAPEKAAALAAERNIKIYTIGVGAEQMRVPGGFFGPRFMNPSSDLDEATLRKIAVTTGGRYFRARDTQELSEIYRLLDDLEPVEQDERTYRPIRSWYWVPLAGAFVLSLLLGIAQSGLRRSFSRSVSRSGRAAGSVASPPLRTQRTAGPGAPIQLQTGARHAR